MLQIFRNYKYLLVGEIIMISLKSQVNFFVFFSKLILFQGPGDQNNEKGRALVFIPQIPGLTVKKYEFDKTRALQVEEVKYYGVLGTLWTLGKLCMFWASSCG